MTLLLEIVSSQGEQFVEAARKRFVEAGGTIGRLPECDWVIADPFISALHARIHYRDGCYLLEDLSANGIFINSRDRRLRRDELYMLRNGDHVFMDHHEISVTFADEANLTERLEPPQAPSRAQSGIDPMLTLPLTEPAGAIVDSLIPEYFEPLVPVGTSAMSTPPSPPRAISPELSMQLFGQIPPEVMSTIVAGVLDVLRSREEIKHEIGMRMTTVKAADNNPLKFSANVEDALHNLFVKHNPAYLQPAEAFEDAFLEVRHHQMAMMAALKIVFRDLLETFEPRRLQEEFARQADRAAWVPFLSRLRYWRSYRRKFSGLSEDPERSFRSMFGEKFAAAYAEQLTHLKSAPRR